MTVSGDTKRKKTDPWRLAAVIVWRVGGFNTRIFFSLLSNSCLWIVLCKLKISLAFENKQATRRILILELDCLADLNGTKSHHNYSVAVIVFITKINLQTHCCRSSTIVYYIRHFLRTSLRNCLYIYVTQKVNEKIPLTRKG